MTQPRQSFPSGFMRWIKSSAFTNQMGMLLIVLAIIFGAITYGALTTQGPFKTASADTVYILLNIDLVIFILLCVMIMRRFFMLWRKRKEKAAGTKLQMRLVRTFGLLALIPSVMMALFSITFFYFAVQSWFSERVETAVNESLSVAQAYLREHQKVIQADALAMANDLNRDVLSLIGNQTLLTRVVERQSFLRNLTEAMIFEGGGRVIAKSGFTFTLEFDSLPLEYLDRARTGDVVVLTDDEEDRVRALVHLSNFGDNFLYVGRSVEPGILDHVQKAEKAVLEYLSLDSKKTEFQLSITLIFLFVGLLVLLAAGLFGLIFARRIADPLAVLIQATERVRGGDFHVQIDEKQITKHAADDDEIVMLVRAFNKMTHQINDHQKDLIAANRMLDNRRHFIEAIFSGVTSGIIGLNANRTISLVNQSAMDIVGAPENQLVGYMIDDINKDIAALLEKGTAKNLDLIQDNIEVIQPDGKAINVLVRIAYERKDADQLAVISLDDVTDLIAAQRKAAWSGVARRIAHEIKNPLTPIQLSAERLQRKYASQITTDADTFKECIDTIVRQVSEIGRMVNEFSEFARMPEPSMKDEDIHALIRSCIVLQRQAYPAINFIFDSHETAEHPMVFCDAGLIRQALINIIKNAVEAIQETQTSQPEIRIETKKNKQMLEIHIHDTGPGIADDKAGKLFEPYVTTKEKGTGLGLAIVKKIMEDHKGGLTLQNRIGHNRVIGATAVLSLPQ